jgi:hypothetical protein
MATTGIKHRKTSGKSDGADSTLVQPSNWDDTHITDAAALLLDTDPSYSGARTFTPRDNLRGTDGGAGSTYSLDVIPDAKVIDISDDFLPTLANNSIIGQLGWAVRNDFNAGFSVANQAAIQNHPGIIRLTASGAAVSGDGFQLDLGGQSFGGTQSIYGLANLAGWECVWIVRLNQTTNFRIRFGFYSATGGGSPPEFIGIRYDTSLSDTGWKGEARTSSVSTATSALATVDTNFHTFKIRSTSAGTILFSIDGGSELSLNSGLPSSSQVFVPGLVAAATASNPSFNADVDYWSFYQRSISR